MQLGVRRKMVMSKRILGEGKVVRTKYAIKMLVKEYLGKGRKLCLGK